MAFLNVPFSGPMRCDLADRSRFNTTPVIPAQLGNGKYGDLSSL
jgi:hypothetical protein